MRSVRVRSVLWLLASFGVVLVFGCSRGANSQQAPPIPAAGTALAPPSGTSVSTFAPSASPTLGATPVAGASFVVGSWTVVVDRYRAQVSEAEGVNIRSSPEVKPENRTGSLPGGASVEVEGRVPQGQEALAGQGTNWYYLGTVGSTPQFIYGPPGTLTRLNGSATAVPSPSPAGTP